MKNRVRRPTRSLPAAARRSFRFAVASTTAWVATAGTLPALAQHAGTSGLPGSITGQLDVVSTSVSIFTGLNVNQFLGAGTFYDAGYTGTRAVIANVEGGHIWPGHETLTHATTRIDAGLGGQNGDDDRHATSVGGFIAGRLSGSAFGEFQRGIAYDATLWSGAIATTFSGLSFNASAVSLTTAYNTVFASGIAGRTADVVNSSWGFTEPTGSNATTATLDGLARQNPLTTFVTSAGNSGPSANTVGGAGAGYNNLTVAALGNAPSYDTVSGFSSRGLNDYADPVNGTIPGVRAAVDIAAPGQTLTGAFYGGTTGGNTGGTDLTAGAGNFYSGNLAGTSYASPIVAGGAGLVIDAAYAALPGSSEARDSRVVKAILLDSADKTPGWNNAQTLSGSTWVTTQGLDAAVGAGVMNLDSAYSHLLNGTTDVPGLAGGVVSHLGWDLGSVASGSPTEYRIADLLGAGTRFTTTLTWNRDRSYTFNAQDGGTVSDDSFDDLNLEVWELIGGIPVNRVAASESIYNNVEHLSFLLPATGWYAIRVLWNQELFDMVSDANLQTFGLSWSSAPVPEPATVALGALLLAGLPILHRHRRQGQLRPPTDSR